MSHYERKNKPVLRLYKDEAASKDVQGQTDEFLDFFSQSDQAAIQKRSVKYKEIANHFYDLVTDFYEYGWGTSFHFAYPKNGESYETAMKRLEYYLAYKMEIKKDQKVLDVGCGVGGPMREVARFSGAKVVGLNNNLYQIKKGEKYNSEAGLSSLCSFSQADYMQRFPFEDNTFDGVFTLEAICYAPDREKVYAEIFRVLKPGAYFAGTDWCMTEKYNPNDPLHFKLKESIVKGNGIYDLLPSSNVVTALQQVGFQLAEIKDLISEENAGHQWYQPLATKWSLKGFPRTAVGRFMTTQMVRVLETLRFAPKGTTLVTNFLNEAADSLVKAGELQIFTPGFFFLARKPLQ
jgi:sterol 24-C-methyltransferase